jgi:hypothetical protein
LLSITQRANPVIIPLAKQYVPRTIDNITQPFHYLFLISRHFLATFCLSTAGTTKHQLHGVHHQLQHLICIHILCTHSIFNWTGFANRSTNLTLDLASYSNK